MSDRAQNDTHDEATSTPDPIDDEVSWAEDETETSEVTGAEDSPTLETAVSALQGLLEAVTLLGGTNADNERQGGQGR